MGKMYGSPAGTAVELNKICFGDENGKAKEFTRGYVGDGGGIARMIFGPPRGPIPILPDAYQQVEYIYNAAKGPYIETGLTFGTQSKLSAILSFPTFPTGGGNIQYYNGVEGASNEANHYFGHAHSSSGDKFRAYLRVRKKFSDGSYGYGTVTVLINSDHNAHTFILDGKNRSVSVDNTSDSSTYSLITTTKTLTLFGCKGSSSITQKALQRLYSFKWYNNNVLARNFYPCYRKADNVIGLYEILTGTFFTNQGTGSFLKGPDYIGEL